MCFKKLCCMSLRILICIFCYWMFHANIARAQQTKLTGANSFVIDYTGGLISTDTASEIDNAGALLESATKYMVYVIVVPSFESNDIDTFCDNIFINWDISYTDSILIIDIDGKQYRMLGSVLGAEHIESIFDETARINFQAGRFAEGIVSCYKTLCEETAAVLNISLSGLEYHVKKDTSKGTIPFSSTYNSFASLMFSAINNHQTRIDDIEYLRIVENQINSYIRLFHNENLATAWVINKSHRWWYNSNNIVTQLALEYNLPDKDVIAWRSSLDMSIDEFISSIPIGLNDYEVLSYLNKYLIDHVVYNRAVDNALKRGNASFKGDWWVYTPMALPTGDGVCQGYAEIFQLIATKLGFECKLVSGSTKNGGRQAKTTQNTDHAWNMVKLDGTWYHVDVTWNDHNDLGKYKPLESGHYYRIDNKKFCDIDSYIEYMSTEYFLKSDQFMRDHEHHWWIFQIETEPVVANSNYNISNSISRLFILPRDINSDHDNQPIVTPISNTHQEVIIPEKEKSQASIMPIFSDFSQYIEKVTLIYDKTINIRSGPGSNFTQIGEAYPGVSFYYTGQEENGYYQIIYPYLSDAPYSTNELYQTCYISKSLTTVSQITSVDIICSSVIGYLTLKPSAKVYLDAQMTVVSKVTLDNVGYIHYIAVMPNNTYCILFNRNDSTGNTILWIGFISGNDVECIQ